MCKSQECVVILFYNRKLFVKTIKSESENTFSKTSPKSIHFSKKFDEPKIGQQLRGSNFVFPLWGDKNRPPPRNCPRYLV